jgi:2-amino-4-hydroxy-6-hydroxymethyldihydropteridine diphosphokinase
LGLGSNLGDRRAQILKAIMHLQEEGLPVKTCSAIYETEPVGISGPDFFNLVCRLVTSLEPFRLLETCLEIEARMGRLRGPERGPRTIDIDLLYHGDLIRFSRSLVLPHPAVSERRFVLVPMQEIAPGFRDPLTGLTMSETLARCRDRSEVRWIGELEQGSSDPAARQSAHGPVKML